MSKHTPGPWEYRVDYMECPYVASKTKHMIADVNLAFVSGKEAKANARLISCAPEMLEALKLVLTLNGNPRRDCEDEAEWKKIMGNINALIARIEEE